MVAARTAYLGRTSARLVRAPSGTIRIKDSRAWVARIDSRGNFALINRTSPSHRTVGPGQLARNRARWPVAHPATFQILWLKCLLSEVL